MEENVLESDLMYMKLPKQDVSEENRSLELEFYNSTERRGFEKTTISKRVLFLPHCLRKVSTCKGEYNESGFICAFCNRDCPIFRLKTFAEVLGYKVLIAPGGSVIKKFLEQNVPEAIVAVACYDELVAGLAMVRHIRPKTPTQVIYLSKTGCANTEVDVERVKEVLRISQVVCPKDTL